MLKTGKGKEKQIVCAPFFCYNWIFGYITQKTWPCVIRESVMYTNFSSRQKEKKKGTHLISSEPYCQKYIQYLDFVWINN